ncbi:2-hydroxy-palmitic acid dioxygenase mpo1-like isoform X2 [Dioscorea cayenensis subsp. rotundata]|uniref:2-hydroxy-palmitic acid dioxygenase mpo1-like isoform X2 n=1 Tax=Dioscorea cayennensis subsp. rotundata TaxID=55577 RepID=A0AB40BEY2_DIOCR|nr:2-hydroxy-palmitic acid dioxygenase mpo1-like isoform X2 [Dioscorea cayenensis subsp. rotundata]
MPPPWHNSPPSFTTDIRRPPKFLQKMQFKMISMASMGNGGRGLFDLEKHFAFYAAYHTNPINVLIHMLFVWPIFFTFVVLLHFTPPLIRLPVPFSDDLSISSAFGVAFVYALFYVLFDRKAGSLAALLCMLCWLATRALARRLGFSLAWKVVLAVQLFCWTGQFIGHGIFEKRSPALLDNLSQAFLMAPFFVLLEALRDFFGYEPYPDFYANVQAKIKANRKAQQRNKHKFCA